MVKKERKKRVVGWKEHVALPDLKIKQVIAKIDTGANVGSIHAADIKIKKKNKVEYVHFKVMKRKYCCCSTIFLISFSKNQTTWKSCCL